MTDNIIISDPQKLASIIETMASQGADKLHILSDFDRTLTSCFKDGQKAPVMIQTLKEAGALTAEYHIKAQALFDYYHPIEIDPNISRDELRQKMEEWYRKHFALLVQSGLSRDDVIKASRSDRVALRSGVDTFLDLLKGNNIPLIIFSGSGLGGESIELLLRERQRYFSNIHLVANTIIWDEAGKMKGVKEPIIHVANKDETLIHNFPCYSEIKDRKNIILLGDGLGDVDMTRGFDYDNLIKVGFLNENIETNLSAYQAAFDVLILNDGSFDYINDLLTKIIK